MTSAAAPAIADTACPRLAPHFMFRWEDSQDAYVLLYPEGLIKLNRSAGEILNRCDGRSVAQIIADLQVSCPFQEVAIAEGTRAFIDLAHHKGWLKS